MITVVTPVSPIKSHPDTTILEETITSVRTLLPSAEIFLTFDGVRDEQKSRQADYDEFIHRTLWLSDHVWGNVVPFLFEEHQHQSGMMRHIIDKIDTSLLLYVEQDTPIVTDEPIDMPAIEQLEQALDTFGGTVLLVTHDRSLLESVRITRTITMENGQMVLATC